MNGPGKNWFANLEARQLEINNEAANSNSPRQKIEAAMNQLKVKAYSHALRSVKHEDYFDAAKTAFNLYHYLHKEASKCFRSKEPDINQLQQNCILAIEAAMPVLEIHRGHKQALLDIINVILEYVTFRPKRADGERWRLFKANTASIETINKISESIDDALDVDKGSPS